MTEPKAVTKSEQIEGREVYPAEWAIAEEGNEKPVQIPIDVSYTDLFMDFYADEEPLYSVETSVKTVKASVYRGTFRITDQYGQVVAEESRTFHKRQRLNVHQSLLADAKSLIYEGGV